jgi:hypothetical protein
MSLDELEKLNLTIRMAAFRWRRANILYHKVCVCIHIHTYAYVMHTLCHRAMHRTVMS